MNTNEKRDDHLLKEERIEGGIQKKEEKTEQRENEVRVRKKEERKNSREGKNRSSSGSKT